MELDEFIKTTLIQVVKGVTEAQKDVQQFNAAVNPSESESSYGSSENYPYLIDFDIAVTVEDSGSSTGGAAIQVLGMSAGGKADTANSISQNHRIKFEVPVQLPIMKNVGSFFWANMKRRMPGKH